MQHLLQKCATSCLGTNFMQTFPISFGWTMLSIWWRLIIKNEIKKRSLNGLKKASITQTWPINCKSWDTHVEKLKYIVYITFQRYYNAISFLGSNAEQPQKMKYNGKMRTNPRITAAATWRAHVGEVIQYLSLNFWRAQWYYRGQQIQFVSKQVITFVSSHENNLLR